MPDSQLTAEASVAYHAFQEMRKSKQSYFEFLQNIEAKYKSGGEASSEETDDLAKRLAIHDKNVAAFNDAMNAVEDFDAKNDLIKLMS